MISFIANDKITPTSHSHIHSHTHTHGGLLGASLVLLDKGQVLVDVVGGADHEGNPLVERFGLDVQDPLRAGGGQAPRLLDEEGDGVALVQQPQLLERRGENIQTPAVKASCHFLST